MGTKRLGDGQVWRCPAPSMRVTSPSNRGELRKPPSVRYRLISASGWGPLATRRKIFSITEPPTIRELLDCSTDSQVTESSSAIGTLAAGLFAALEDNLAFARRNARSRRQTFKQAAREHGEREGVGQQTGAAFKAHVSHGQLLRQGLQAHRPPRRSPGEQPALRGRAHRGPPPVVSTSHSTIAGSSAASLEMQAMRQVESVSSLRPNHRRSAK